MPFDRIAFSRCIAFALAGDDMQKLWPRQLALITQRAHERIDVVPVDRADVIKAELFEETAGQHHALEIGFRATREFPGRRHLAQHLLAGFAQRRIFTARENAREIIRQRAHVLRNRHVVVVEHDQHVGTERACVI